MDVNETFTQSGAGITDAELKLWELMRDQQLNGFKFIRQVLVEPFIVDFVCVSTGVGDHFGRPQDAEGSITFF